MRLYWIDKYWAGSLAVTARPRGNDWLGTEIEELAAQDVTLVVSLLEEMEMAELGISNEGELCTQAGIRFVNFPIVDRTLPNDEKAFRELVFRLDDQLNAGAKVLVHCRMGIGRTGMLAAAVLICAGVDANDVFTLLSEKRTLEMPDTLEQAKWIKEREWRRPTS